MKKREATATMCVREFQYQIPYGVVNSKDNVIEESMTEKPSYFFRYCNFLVFMLFLLSC